MQKACSTLALALAILVVAGGTGCVSPGTTSSGRSASPEPLPERPRVDAEPIPFEIVVSPVARLVHWLDNLSGVGGGKTREVYLDVWTARYGVLDAADREQLKAWATARRSERGAPMPSFAVDSELCYPVTPLPRSPRHVFSSKALVAPSLDALFDESAAVLSAENAARMRGALLHFRDRIDAEWGDDAFLQDFAKRLRAFLSSPEAVDLNRRFVHLMSVTDTREPSVLSLVAVPRGGAGTHAEAFGRHLLLEVRPGERPERQAQVVFHELVHDLWARMPPSRRAEWARGFLTRGAPGALAWALQHEALPTALGQGVAEATLAPRIWRRTKPWYDVRQVDVLAKRIYPLVDARIAAGARLDVDLARRTTELAQETPVLAAPPLAHFAEALWVAPREWAPLFETLRKRFPLRRAWPVTLEDDADRRLAARYSCLPALVLARPGDAARLAALGLDPSALRSGSLTPTTRASGAAALVMVADDLKQAVGLVRRMVDLRTWPEASIGDRSESLLSP